MRKFVALYGGSFNLPTLAHRAVGACVRDLVEPDEVWYMVSPQNPHKSSEHMAEFRHRLEMAKLNVCGMSKIIVTDIEQQIAQETGSSASADTLRELKKRFSDTRFCWVMGADAFLNLHTWKDFKYILENASIVILPRAPFTSEISSCPAARQPGFPALASAKELARRKGWCVLHAFPEGSINATAEREKIRAGRRPDANNVHPAVADYVIRNGLRF